MCYVTVYTWDSTHDEVGSYVATIQDTPENIAAFIMHNGMKEDYCFIDIFDNLKASNKGIFLDYVPNQKYCLEELQPAIIAMQMGMKKIPEIQYFDFEKMER